VGFSWADDVEHEYFSTLPLLSSCSSQDSSEGSSPTSSEFNFSDTELDTEGSDTELPKEPRVFTLATIFLTPPKEDPEGSSILLNPWAMYDENDPEDTFAVSVPVRKGAIPAWLNASPYRKRGMVSDALNVSACDDVVGEPERAQETSCGVTATWLSQSVQGLVKGCAQRCAVLITFLPFYLCYWSGIFALSDRLQLGNGRDQELTAIFDIVIEDMVQRYFSASFSSMVEWCAGYADVSLLAAGVLVVFAITYAALLLWLDPLFAFCFVSGMVFSCSVELLGLRTTLSGLWYGLVWFAISCVVLVSWLFYCLSAFRSLVCQVCDLISRVWIAWRYFVQRIDDKLLRD
jgi:hypothetical protein